MLKRDAILGKLGVVAALALPSCTLLYTKQETPKGEEGATASVSASVAVGEGLTIPTPWGEVTAQGTAAVVLGLALVGAVVWWWVRRCRGGGPRAD